MALDHQELGTAGIGQAGHRSAFRFLMLPLGVFLLANIIFSLTAFDIQELVTRIQPLVPSGENAGRSFEEAGARTVWATSVVLFYTTFIAGAAFCLGIVGREPSPQARLRIAGAGAVIAGLMLVYLALSSHLRAPFSYIFYFTYDILAFSERFSPGELLAVRAVVSVLNVLAGLVPALALVTGCCIMSAHAQAGQAELEMLEKRMRNLKLFTVMGSALLMSGVLHMNAWLSWPAALVESRDVAEQVAGFSRAVGVFWGTTFSLTLASFYIPAARSLHGRATEIFEQSAQHSRGEELQGWLEKHGLSITPMRQLPQVGAILAPVLTGSLGGMLENIALPLTGS